MAKDIYRYVFGPVPSRRLGCSLGIDIVPFKTCTYNCVYCQIGATQARTVERAPYAPVEDVLDEIARRLERGVDADYLTLSGSGEPTLHSGIGGLVAGIKEITDIPVAVLTNGSLLWDSGVADALSRADLVLPSLDAGCEESFRLLNRPHENITFDAMAGGLASFRAGFKGALWLEVFLVKDLNDSESEVRRIAEIARRIAPDRIQLNTVARPPAEESARAVPEADLRRLAPLLGENAEVVAVSDRHGGSTQHHAEPGDVLDMLKRRPCSAEDVARGLSIAPAEARTILEALAGNGLARVRVRGETPYYVAGGA